MHTFQYLPHQLGRLSLGSDGNLYGTTVNGGLACGGGTAYKFLTSSLTLNNLHNFNCTEGAHPMSGLTQGPDGKFYGTTRDGGGSAAGSVFRVGPFGGNFAVLHTFTGSPADGALPLSPLLLATDGNFYGTTSAGGSTNNGVVFRIDTAGTLIVLHNFILTDGMSPAGALMQHTSGLLYGVTFGGGGSHQGTVFSVNPGLGQTVRIVPTSARIGMPVTILGTKLTGARSVRFNSAPAAFTVVSDSEITTTAPAGATTGKVQATTPRGTLFSQMNFVVTP